MTRRTHNAWGREITAESGEAGSRTRKTRTNPWGREVPCEEVELSGYTNPWTGKFEETGSRPVAEVSRQAVREAELLRLISVEGVRVFQRPDSDGSYGRALAQLSRKYAIVEGGGEAEYMQRLDRCLAEMKTMPPTRLVGR